MTDPFELHEALPDLESPVLVSMLTGWIDASGAAAAATEYLLASCATRELATFDGDLFIDYRARRPTMELREGVSTRMVWPRITLHVGTTPAGRDLLVLSGAEPDSAWLRFADAATRLSSELGVSQVVLFGAYPFACPHTRPSRLSCTSPSAELVARVPFLKTSVDVPAGMGAVLEHTFANRGVDAIGLWAQVPHYLGTMSFPGASVALLDGLQTITGLTVDTEVLRTEAGALRERIDQLVAANPEHEAMVRQMEAIYDAEAERGASPSSTLGGLGSNDLPSADELAAEVERFLRDQDT